MIKNRISLYRYSEKLEKSFEEQYCNYLNKIGKNNVTKLRKKSKQYRKILKNNKYKKDIWIINDKKKRAGDNGEYFFRYLKSKKPRRIDVFFAIDKNCSDYERLKKFGNIINFDTYDYLNIFLNSDKIISSVYDFWEDNPFGDDHKYIRDLFHFQLIFIQNGIIKDDLSKNLNRLKRNINLFVTSTKKEYNSILSYNYGYKNSEVILSGLPRFDHLESQNKKFKNIKDKTKIILVMPTWRLYIKRKKESLIYESIHSDNFKNTDYFHFYNELINNENLIKSMELYNYTGIFCLHPYFAAQWIDFTKNKRFEIKDICDYQNLLIKGSLLITDYSSIFFDFGYLKKPIIYAHFDYEEYRLNHYPEGYFNYNEDGFGSIAKDINSTVNLIIKSMKYNCKLEEKYLIRINSFFTFYDEHNSDRLYQKIAKTTIKKENNCSFINH